MFGSFDATVILKQQDNYTTETSLSVGALLLFITNLTGIIFSGVIILLLQSYGSIERAKQGLIFTVTSLLILGLPLGWSLKSLIVQNNVRHEVNEIVRREIPSLSNSDIRTIAIQNHRNNIVVELTIAATPGSIDRDRLVNIQDLLTQELNKNIDLKVKIIPIDTFIIKH